MGFIEELYYQELDPQRCQGDHEPRIQRELQVLDEREEQLTRALSGEVQSWFIEYVNAWSTVNGTQCLDSFISGFRYGARFAQDAFRPELN